MVSVYILNLRNIFLSRVEALTRGKYWKIRVTLVSALLSLFFSFPSFQAYNSGKWNEKWAAIDKQVEEPLTPHTYEDGSHYSKLAFRLTPALIAHALHMGRAGCFLLQYVSFFILFYLLLSLAFSCTDNKTTATLISLAFSFMFVGNVLVSDLRAMFDVTAFCLMAAAMLSKRASAIMFLLLLAFFTDERALIASPIIGIWFIVRSRGSLNLTLRSVFTSSRGVYFLLLSWVTYFIARFILSVLTGLRTGNVEGGLLFEQANNIPFGAWTGIEGFWLLIPIGLGLLLIKKDYLMSFLLTLSILAVMITAYSVKDITRSVAYVFPIIFVFLLLIRKHESSGFLLKLCLTIFLLCLFPTYYTDGKGFILYYYPLPFRLAGLTAG